jgi:hypothetical protein
MRGGRKHKAASSSSRGGGSHHKSPEQRQHKQLVRENKVDDQLHQCMEEQIISNHRSSVMTWKEALMIFMVAILMVIASVGVGIAAVMTISIHYYEEPGAATAAHRVTTLDSDIQSIPLLPIYTEDVVVQELPPLGEQTFPQENHTQGMFRTEATIQPTLCSDGITMGFQDWNTLKAAIREANSLSAEKFLRWNEYFAEGQEDAFDDKSLYYEEDVFFTICPGTTLKARKGPIYINAENIVLECDGCTVDVDGTHLAFGPHARNVLVRGATFKGAQTSSLTFYHDGSEATFEDCYWFGNSGNGKSGAVADVNSTRYVCDYSSTLECMNVNSSLTFRAFNRVPLRENSSLVFYRCEIDDKNNVARYSRGARGIQNGLASSLSIRT